jgi:hypothetical protein
MTVYNTANKLSRRTLSELDGLYVGQLESSYREYNDINTLSVTTQNVSTYNSMNKLSRRTIVELTGLYIKIFEQSAKTRSLIGTFKITKPSKKYNQKLTLHYKYSVKLKQ